jgi:hypothetical protein
MNHLLIFHPPLAGFVVFFEALQQAPLRCLVSLAATAQLPPQYRLLVNDWTDRAESSRLRFLRSPDELR